MKEKILQKIFRWLLIIDVSLCFIASLISLAINPCITTVFSVVGLLLCVCYFLKR